MQPSAVAPTLHYANLCCLGSVKITLPFSPTGPLQTAWFSLSEVLHKCFLPRLSHAWQTTEVQMRVATHDRLRQWAHPRHYCGNDKMLWNSLHIFYYFNCKIYYTIFYNKKIFLTSVSSGTCINISRVPKMIHYAEEIRQKNGLSHLCHCMVCSFSSTSFLNKVNTDLKFGGCKRMLTQTIRKYNSNPLSHFTFSNTTEAGSEGDLFTKLTFESRNIKLLFFKKKKKK